MGRWGRDPNRRSEHGCAEPVYKKKVPGPPKQGTNTSSDHFHVDRHVFASSWLIHWSDPQINYM